MSEFDTKTFKKNIKFFIIAFVFITICFIISLFTNVADVSLEESEIEVSGEVNINDLVINEIQSSNGGILSDNGNLYDWIEIYNGTGKDIDLSGYGLSDSNDKIKWVFPDDTTIKSKAYLVVYLAGINSDGLYANFKLKSSGGEELVLRKENKKVVDAVKVEALSKGQVMARDLDGNFKIYSTATPGFINTKEGFDAFYNTLTVETDEEKLLSINEILPKNKGYFKDGLGEYSGYVEIKNISKQTVNLASYNLSNDVSRPFRYQLPDYNLKSGEIFLVFTSNRNIITDNNEYHASFSLYNKNGTVVLTHNSKIIEEVTYTSLTSGKAYIKENNKFYEGSNISPGYENTNKGVKSFQNKYLTYEKDLVINEVMTSNYSHLAQNGGKYYDWIELYNNSGEDINLKDYYLSTNDDELAYNLPDVVLKKKSYIVIMASGDSNLSNKSYNHANFKLGNSEGIYLFKKNKIIDSMYVSDIPVGYSMGKDKNGGYLYYKTPTPNKKNGAGTIGIAYAPIFSKEGGVYNDTKSISLTLSSPSEIYYTTDGSTPNKKSKKYTKAINITKTTVIKAISYKTDNLPSEVVTNSYIMNENHTLEVMSVSIDPSNFNKIQRNPGKEDYEFLAYSEFFSKNDEGFDIPCGLKLFGGSTRWHSKKSFSINFRKKYGEGSLNYQVFDNRDFSGFESLVLRTASQDEERAFIRDILGTSLVDGMINVDVQAYRPIILYINGKYWGIYFIREKVNTDFIANHYNTDIESSETNILRIDGDVKSGSSKSYKELLEYIKTHDLSKTKHYEYVKTKIDVESLADFWAAELYVTNNDIVNCRYFSNPEIDGGKWKWIFYDLDYAFYNESINYYNFQTSPSGMTFNGYSTFLLRNMLKNSEFKQLYLERISYQMNNVWTKERIMKKYNEILDVLTPEMERNFKRWGNNSMQNWKSRLKELTDYINKREKYLKKHSKTFFNLSNSKYNKYFGGKS